MDALHSMAERRDSMRENLKNTASAKSKTQESRLHLSQRVIQNFLYQP